MRVSVEAVSEAEDERSVVDVVGVTGCEKSLEMWVVGAVTVAIDEDVGDVTWTPGGGGKACCWIPEAEGVDDDACAVLLADRLPATPSPPARTRGGGMLDVEPPGVLRRG